MRKYFVLMGIILFSAAIKAETVEINGVYYNLVNKTSTAEVTINSNGYKGHVEIPASVEYDGKSYDVISIGNHAFASNSELTSIAIPATIESIGEHAFYSCWKLTALYITDLKAWCNISMADYSSNPLNSNFVEHYQHILYLNSQEVKNLVIPDDITTIKDYVFYGFKNLNSITFHSNIKSIGKYSFRNCKQLSELLLPSGLETIDESAFEGCSGLTSVTIPPSVSSIGNSAFYDCNSLKSVDISDINSWCRIRFSGFSSNPLFYAKHIYLNGNELKEVSIPNDVESIYYTFINCLSITGIHIPTSVIYIDENAFQNCGNIASITVEDGNPSYDSRNHCNALIDNKTNLLIRGCYNTVIPSSITAIGNNAFSCCVDLDSINIPSSVKSIGSYSFNKCPHLSVVVLGSGIETIGENYCTGPFAYCQELSNVYCHATSIPKVYGNTFTDSYVEHAILHVPESAINEYKNNEPWNNFGKIITLNGDEIEEPITKTCSTPTITYTNGKLTFNCDTEGAECVATINDADIKTHYGNEISLTATYTVSVYATATGYENSDVTTATLCWLDAEPKTEGMTSNITAARGNAILIQSNNGTMNISGVSDGANIVVYSSSGTVIGSTKASCSSTSINTGLRNGEIAIVKIDDKAVKVVMK